MRSYEILAPAKVNLTLHVLGRRPDGFHDLASLMVPLDLADRLEVEVGGAEIAVRVPGHPELEGDANLCAKAARAFAAHTGLPGGARIVLHKAVPMEAGLGGGSSDAAAVLRCLAHSHELSVDDPRIRAAALEVGSDVPFFLHCRPALARGRGELLHPAPALPPLWLVVIKPAFGVSAAAAYRTLAALRAEGRLPPGEEGPLPEALPDPAAVRRLLHNDLEAAVATLHPIDGVRERLAAAGAARPLMSGSGSCVFAVLDDREGAEKCSKSIGLLPGERVFAIRTLQAPPPLHETSGVRSPS